MINFLTASLSSLAISVFALASAHEPVSRSAPATALVQSAPPSTAPAVVWPTNDSGLKAWGETLTKAGFAKIVAKDWAAVEGQLHPSFQRINFEGAFDRAAEIAEIKALAVGAPTFNTFHATRVGEALVVTCMTAVREENKENPKAWTYFWMRADDAKKYKDSAGLKPLIDTLNR